MNLRYDGTLTGLLTTYGMIDSGSLPLPRSIDRPPFPEYGLFDQVCFVETDIALARHFAGKVCAAISPRSFEQLRLAFLSEQPGIELMIWRYLDHGWRVGSQLDCHLAQVDVHAVHCWARRTAREAHRLLGLARFSETADGTWYAPMQPDTNVVPLLAPHFARRLDRFWVLHDVARGVGAMGREGGFILGRIDTVGNVSRSVDEEGWQDLWRTFHGHVAIPERSSRQRQRCFMPVKYWEYLPELNCAV